jgi:hypothetical protein
MKRISFDKRFVNEAGNSLIPGKIHTIRQNYDYWKKFEGKEVALFTWEGKPYRSKQKVFCVKKIVSVQEVELQIKKDINVEDGSIVENIYLEFYLDGWSIDMELLAKDDGFINFIDLVGWFENYKSGKMAILHFTNFRY